MTTPEHIREEALRLWADFPKESAGIAYLERALLAAEKRGMERAAEIADAERAEYERMASKLGDEDWTLQAKHDHAAEACGDIASSIRKARKERG